VHRFTVIWIGWQLPGYLEFLPIVTGLCKLDPGQRLWPWGNVMAPLSGFAFLLCIFSGISRFPASNCCLRNFRSHWYHSYLSSSLLEEFGSSALEFLLSSQVGLSKHIHPLHN
jgi:hypothetical protein